MPPSSSVQRSSQSRTSAAADDSVAFSSGSSHWPVNHLRLFVLAVIVVLSALLLAGSATSSLSNIYIVSLSYQLDSLPTPTAVNNGTISAAFDTSTDTNSLREVRVGYIGLCARTSLDLWNCDASPFNLVQSLRDANQTDHLNLIWAGNQLQTEAVTSIFVYITVVGAFLNLILGISYPISGASMSPWLERGVSFLQQPVSFIGPTVYSSFVIMLVAFASFNVALWQHLSGAISASMTDILAFEAIICRAGPTAIALAWVSFVLAAVSVILLVIEKQRDLNRMWLLGILSFESAPADNMNAEDAGGNIDIVEDPPQSTWQQPQVLPFSVLLRYLGGQEIFERTIRQRHTATWVDRNDQHDQMQPGYAETIVDDA